MTSAPGRVMGEVGAGRAVAMASAIWSLLGRRGLVDPERAQRLTVGPHHGGHVEDGEPQVARGRPAGRPAGRCGRPGPRRGATRRRSPVATRPPGPGPWAGRIGQRGLAGQITRGLRQDEGPGVTRDPLGGVGNEGGGLGPLGSMKSPDATRRLSGCASTVVTSSRRVVEPVDVELGDGGGGRHHPGHVGQLGPAEVAGQLQHRLLVEPVEAAGGGGQEGGGVDQ